MHFQLLNISYNDFKSYTGISGGVIAGISVAGVIVVLCLVACFYFGFYKRKYVVDGLFFRAGFGDDGIEHMHGSPWSYYFKVCA